MTTSLITHAPARAATDGSPREAPSGRPWLTLAALSLGLMMVLLDTSIVSVANPTIGKDLGGSLADLQWVTSAFLLAIATGLVIGGKLGDHYGRRRLFITGAAWFALTSAGCGLSTSIGMLIGFRAAQGLAAAAMMPQTLSTLRATFQPQRFQLAVGSYVAVSSVAIASGPIVGGVLVQDVGWRAIFFINVILGAIVVATARAFVPETKNPRAGGLDTTGALLLAAALFCLVWAIVNSASHPWGSGYTLGFLAAAVVLLAGWAVRMARAEAPLIPLCLFRSASFDAGIGVVTTIGFTLYGTLFYLMLYLQRVQGHSPITAGAELLPLTVLSGAVAPIGGLLAHRIPLRLLLAGGLLLIGGGSLGITTIEPHIDLASLWPWFALIGIGVGCSLTGGSQAVVGSAPPARAGVATGIQQTPKCRRRARHRRTRLTHGHLGRQQPHRRPRPPPPVIQHRRQTRRGEVHHRPGDHPPTPRTSPPSSTGRDQRQLPGCHHQRALRLRGHRPRRHHCWPRCARPRQHQPSSTQSKPGMTGRRPTASVTTSGDGGATLGQGSDGDADRPSLVARASGRRLRRPGSARKASSRRKRLSTSARMPARRSQRADRSIFFSHRVVVEDSHRPGLYERVDRTDRPLRIGVVARVKRALATRLRGRHWSPR